MRHELDRLFWFLITLGALYTTSLAMKRVAYLEGQMSVYASFAQDNYNTDVYTKAPKGKEKW